MFLFSKTFQMAQFCTFGHFVFKHSSGKVLKRKTKPLKILTTKISLCLKSLPILFLSKNKIGSDLSLSFFVYSTIDRSGNFGHWYLVIFGTGIFSFLMVKPNYSWFAPNTDEVDLSLILNSKPRLIM